MSQIYKLQFQRWVNTLTSQPVNLEIYSDASNQAYGCAIYVVSPTGKRSLLISKCTIAPIKVLTLPKLELTAALLGACLARYVESSLPYEYKLGTCKFFSDSQVTLAWILSSKNTWKPYVTNRVFEIRSLTSTEQWFYIPTAKNPADLLTRFERSSELLTNTLWSEGPGNTQEIQYKEDQLPDPEEERKSQKNVVGMITEAMGFESEIERFSDFRRMLRVFTWVRRWKTKRKEEIALCELNETEHCLILQSQHHWFAMEFKSLLKDEAIPKTSKIAKYRPFQDDQGLLRLGGRLDHALMTPQEKHPIFCIIQVNSRS
uniref:Uncharacterized protein n=1 Tax=Strigamia maritima TaxID=126957 RepID=T1ILW5_STRMM